MSTATKGNKMTSEIKTAIDAFISNFNAAMNGYKMAGYTVGRKWVRVWTGDVGTGENKSAACFIDPTNGNIFKADGWKRPTTNFIRGNVVDYSAQGFTHYGTVPGC